MTNAKRLPTMMDLTPSEREILWLVYSVIKFSGVPPGTAQLARGSGKTMPQVAVLVGGLMNKGYLQRQHKPKFEARLTDKALDAFGVLKDSVAATNRKDLTMRDETRDIGIPIDNSSDGDSIPTRVDWWFDLTNERKRAWARYAPHAQLVERDERIADLERQLAEVTTERNQLRKDLTEERASVMFAVLT